MQIKKHHFIGTLAIGGLLLLANIIFVWPKGSSAVLLNCSTASNIVVPVQECQGLVDLYNNTNGLGWTNAANRNTDTSVCSWYGVTCSSNTVNILNLTNNNLVGSLPASMSGLTNMRTLNLSENNLIGILPTEWSALRLLNFYANDNDLTGSLPSSRSTWTSLSTFEIGQNNLIGTLPSSRSTFSSMINFMINDNNLTGSLPSSRSTWTNVYDVNLANNFFHGQIPASWTSMTTIVPGSLVIDYNCLDTTTLSDPPLTFVNTKAGGTAWQSTQTCIRPARSNLTITKTTTTPTTSVGGNVSYTLTYTNKNNTVTGVFITDTLPAGITYTSASPSPTSVVGQLIRWNIGTFAGQQSGSIIVTGSVDLSVSSGTTLTNSSTISGSYYDSYLQNNTSTADIYVIGNNTSTGNTATGDLMITKSASKSVVQTGEQFSYTIIYTNNDTKDITGYTIYDILPTGFTMTSFFWQGVNYSGSYTPTRTYIGLPVVAGGSGSLIITGYFDSSVVSGTILTNTATISGNITDIDPSNNTASVNVTVIGNNTNTFPVADLTITKSALSGIATIGSTFTYLMTSTFSTGNYLSGVIVKDTLMSGLTYVSATPAADIISGQELTWNIGTRGYDEIDMIYLTVRVGTGFSSGDLISNTATISGDNIDTDMSNNTSTASGVIAIDPIVVISTGTSGGGGGGGGGRAGGGGYIPPSDTTTLGSAPFIESTILPDICPYHDGTFEKFKTTFTDIQNSIYRSAVNTMLDHCLIQGYSNKGMIFGVYNNVKRGEVYKVFTRLAGISFPEVRHPKHRSDKYKLAGDSIKLWARTSLSTHPVNGIITFADIATIADNLLEYKHKKNLSYDPTAKYADAMTRGDFSLFIQKIINLTK